MIFEKINNEDMVVNLLRKQDRQKKVFLYEHLTLQQKKNMKRKKQSKHI